MRAGNERGAWTNRANGQRVTEGSTETMMQTILILNSKGGCGKSTIATNLAAHYAETGVRCRLLDFDPQSSSLHWLAARPADQAAIDGVDASRAPAGVTRSWQMAVPPGIDRVIIDTPAGVGGSSLTELLRRADAVLVPLTSSSIDIRATTHFLGELRRRGLVPRPGLHLGVVVNRLRQAGGALCEFEAFLDRSRIPLVATLSDSEHYLTAAERGIGIFEMDEADETVASARAEWYPLLRWLLDPKRGEDPGERSPRLGVIGAG